MTETTTTTETVFDDGSVIVETTTAESEFIPGEETVSEMPVEIITENSGDISDAVAIAAIEADAAVQIAEVNAEVAIASIEAETEKREITWQEIEALQVSMQEQGRTIAQILATLSQGQADPSTLLASEALEVAEEVTEANSIPPSTLDGTSEIATEVTLENGDEKPVTVEVTAQRRRRLI